jgi:hypothetical protein
MHRSTRNLIVGVLLLLIIGGLYWKFRPTQHALSEAYVAEPVIIVFSTTAQVRQTVAELHWGERVEVLGHSDTLTKVRTIKGVVGWVDGRRLVDRATWQREEELVVKARPMPLQAVGHTKVTTNLRLDPGRESPRIYQLPGSIRVSVLARKSVDLPATPATSGRNAAEKSSDKSSTEKTDAPKREDWLFVTVMPAASSISPAQGGADSPQANQALLVTGNDPAQQAAAAGGPPVPQLAGWVIARFIELNLPATLRDYATSAGMHPVAWFVLNRIQTSSGDKPQYLVAGVTGGDGQACDFTLIRVYTWGAARQRYETAYVESDFCGDFPITVDKQTGRGDPVFHFTALTEKEPRQERTYVMHQTVVRRLREGETIAKPKRR